MMLQVRGPATLEQTAVARMVSKWLWDGLSRLSVQDRHWAECSKCLLHTALTLLGMWEGSEAF